MRDGIGRPCLAGQTYLVRRLSLVALLIVAVLDAPPVLAWTSVNDGIFPIDRGGSTLLADARGNVISVGCLGPAPCELYVLKHTGTLGTELWRHQVSGGCEDKAMIALAFDGAGRVLVGGGCRGPLLVRSAFVALVDPTDGHEIWHADFPDLGLVSVAVDSANNVLAVGSRYGAGDSDVDLIAIKLSAADGAERWRTVIAGAANNVDQATSVAIDHGDDVIVGGAIHDRPAFGWWDFSIVKLSGSDGSEVWRHVIESISGHGGQVTKVAVDSSGNVVATGEAVLVDWCDIVVVKLVDANGTELWRSVVDSPGAGSCDLANTIALDWNDDVVVAAQPYTTIYSVMKYSGATGARAWKHDVPNACACTGGGCAGALAVAVDAVGDVAATGGLAGCQDVTTVKLNRNDGAEAWRSDLDLDGCDDTGLAIAVDGLGDVLVGGTGFVKVGGVCAWPQGDEHIVAKLSGGSGASFTAPDKDYDGVTDADDNCPDYSNAAQDDLDSDGVGDVCDNCVAVANPRLPAGWLAANSWAVLTGGQRDDDFDGFGNKCDAKFPGSLGTTVCPGDLTEYRASNGKNRAGMNCGTSSLLSCAIFDLDESGKSIGPGDLMVYRRLSGKLPGPKCLTCPLTCEAGALRSCEPWKPSRDGF